MGGNHAHGGADYQIWDGLIRVPAWLRNPGFEGMIFEGLEDCEARFFAPHAPHRHLLERYQAKSGVLTREELIAVFNNFQRFEQGYPRVARTQTLVAPALPTKLAWLARDADRLRRARPFYAPFAEVGAASDAAHRTELVSEFGGELGCFLDDNVELAMRALPDQTHALAAFSASLQAAFPVSRSLSRYPRHRSKKAQKRPSGRSCGVKQLQKVMGGADDQPFRANHFDAAQEKLAKAAGLLDLTEDRFNHSAAQTIRLFETAVVDLFAPNLVQRGLGEWPADVSRLGCRMLGTARRDITLDIAFGERGNIGFTAITIVG